MVALFVNTLVFEGRSTPFSALHSLQRTTEGTPQSRALRSPRYNPLGTSPYLRTGPRSRAPGSGGEFTSLPPSHPAAASDYDGQMGVFPRVDINRRAMERGEHPHLPHVRMAEQGKGVPESDQGGPICRYAGIRWPWYARLHVTLLAAHRRGYASVARLEEPTLQPSWYITRFTNRTTKRSAGERRGVPEPAPHDIVIRQYTTEHTRLSPEH